MLRIGRYCYTRSQNHAFFRFPRAVPKDSPVIRSASLVRPVTSLKVAPKLVGRRRHFGTGESEPKDAVEGHDGWMHLPSGLKYREQIEGGGRMPEPGELVKVHYSALILETDTLYESTYQSQYPFQFRINDGSAIRGINEGVATMREGGRRLLYVLPQLGSVPIKHGGRNYELYFHEGVRNAGRNLELRRID
eukprot:gb/GECG01008910.1/.p1 GENE.gb/GECG01008910.1/~~gb/GECG01008910.1/.p1  ORF type:complete len:192 (+),score=13.00 gb/GECG01008910.1/:1-576(+)